MSNNNIQEEWVSLEGFLYMKCQSGALNFFLSKKRMYFGLDEMDSKLVYYRDKSDFDKKRDKIGTIPLENSACTVIDGNPKGFIVHAFGKKYEFEAENEKSAMCWLNSLQRRRDACDNLNIDTPIVNWNRSHSLPHDDIILPFSRPKRVKSFQKKRPMRYIHGKESTEDEIDLQGTEHKVLRVHSFNPAVLNRPRNNTLVKRKISSNEIENQKRRESSICNPNPDTINGEVKPNGEILDNWINSWLDDHMSQTSDCADKSGLSESRDEEEEDGEERGESSGSTSSATSSYDSHDRQSPSSVALSKTDVHVCNELNLLRVIDNRQKEKIQLLTAQKHELEKEVEKFKRVFGETSAFLNGSHMANGNGVSTTPSLSAQNKFLNAEILRLNERCQTAEKRINDYTKKIEQLELEMDEYKKEYVFVLQSCVRIPIREHSSWDNIQVKLFGGDIHEHRVKKLLILAREVDPTLPTFESVTKPGTFHVDEYGFKHTFDDVPLALHYICTQLHEFYQSRSDEYILRKQRWRQILEQEPCVIENNNEIRHLCRAGCPRAMRPKIWRVLIHQQIVDVKNKYGNYYYRNLCSSQGTPAEKHYCQNHQKQITLDLLRTMPNNVHFMSATCKGVTHLQTVLRAYCLHNPRMGYCQGMNFIAATALLFLSPEDAFWFLVGITEKYFDVSYFDQALTGAQADQEVLKELLEQKYPKLAKHLEDHDIDLTTITLNWFIALFFDAVPFQSMLRIWDCFLLEGPKVLFRFAISLLGLYQDEILDRSDTISVIKVLKAAVRLTYDIDGLIKYAFEELNPFPSKAQLQQKQAGYLAILQVRLQKRSQIRNMLDIVHTETDSSDKITDMPIECLTFSLENEGIGYIGIGNQRRGKLSLVSFHKEAANLNILHLDFDCRPVSMTTFEKGMGFISLLSGYVLALHLDHDNVEILWELKLNDVALKLVHCEDRLYAALANGTLAVLEKAFDRAPNALDLYHIPISAAPITDALIIDENLYLAVACKVVILNRITLSTIGNIYVASVAAGSNTPMFEKIRQFCYSDYGIFLITAHSSLIQLWKDNECQLLFDITYDYSQRKPSFDDSDLDESVEIHTLLFHDDQLWIGTIDGYLLLYHVQPQGDFHFHGIQPRSSSFSNRRRSIQNHDPPHFPQQKNRYPAGIRLSPRNNVIEEIPPHRQQMYYIPTHKETEFEETARVQEIPEAEWRTRKISVVIDKLTQQYSVCVEPVARATSLDSDNGTFPYNSTSTQRTSSLSNSNLHKSNLAARRRLLKGCSVDSAVSVFSNDDTKDSNCNSPPTPPRKISHHKKFDQISLLKEELSIDLVDSGEFDETFEATSENVFSEAGLAEESLGDRSPLAIQIPEEKDEDIVYSQSCPQDKRVTAPLSADSTSSKNTMEDMGEVLKLRRKDLDFEDTLLVAVNENEHIDEAKPESRKMSRSYSSIEPSEIKPTLNMNLQMKLKISDKPVRCIQLTRFNDEDIVVTAAGNYGDEEAMLRWRRDSESGLWINDPIVDISVRRKRTLLTRQTSRN